MVESILILALTYTQPKWDDVIKPQLERRDAQIKQIEKEQTALKQVTPVRTAVRGSDSTLEGSIGYALPYGNCVNEPGVKRAVGNPSSWAVYTQTPYIGATALFTFNHVGYIVGIWPNGDIEVRHQNFHANIHRFPRSYFRGFR